MRAAGTGAIVLVLAGTAFGVVRTVHEDHPAGPPPVVMVVFDALPSPMLMKPGGALDADRFPGFARLASDSTWYRNATTVNDSTVKSIPAMLDGRWPSNLRHPTLAGHPVNLFTLLHSRYRVWADEEGTELCPATVCRAQVRSRLLYLLHGRREQRFAASLAQIRRPAASAKPLLWFAHVLLPHEPLRFLPSGKVYEPGADPEPGLDGNESFDDPWLTLQAEQRHLLQLEFTDRLLQDLLARLRATGLYDRALIVVTADHGISFRRKPAPAEPYRLGQLGWRRDLTPYNGQDVAFVPLFVKAPGQHGGVVDDGWVRTVDILPTILRHVGIARPRALAGRALTAVRARPALLRVLTNRRGPLVLDPSALERRRAATIDRRARRFGVGRDHAGLLRIGPHADLIGRPLSAMPILRAGPLRARVWGSRRFAAVDLRGHRLPAHVIGWLDGDRPAGRVISIAVALNRRIAAVSRSFGPIGKLGLNFAAMVPESAFRQGRNDLRVLEIVERGGRLALRPLGGA